MTSKQTWVEVSEGNIQHNLNLIKQEMPNCAIIGIVKTNAYNHGLIGVSKLLENKVDYLGVGRLEEAIDLRENGINCPIIVLSPDLDANNLLKYSITPSIHSIEELEYLTEEIKEKKRNKSISSDYRHAIHLKINTGMNRFGCPSKKIEVYNFINHYFSVQEHIKIEGVYSHFSTTKKDKPKFVIKQLNKFKEVLSYFEDSDIDIPFIHMANSKNAVDFPESRFNAVRIGNALYGQVLSQKDLGFKRALEVKTRVLSVREVSKGERIGYGATYKVKRNKERIAILPIGSYEGFDYIRGGKSYSSKELIKNTLYPLYRHLKPIPSIFFKSQPLNLVGKPNMQFILVDVTGKDINKNDIIDIKIPLFALKESIERVYIK